MNYDLFKNELTVNPVLSTEYFDRHWDEKKYEKFREKIFDLNKQINIAIDEKSDRNVSIIEWRKIFGDSFGKINSQSGSVVRSEQVTQQFQPWAY
jgi:hypothetical protein